MKKPECSPLPKSTAKACDPKPKRAIPWEYCECGCHQTEVKIGEFSCSVFSSYAPFVKGEALVCTGHRLAVPSHSYNFEYFNTWEQVEDRVIVLIKESYSKSSEALEALAKIIAEHGKVE